MHITWVNLRIVVPAQQRSGEACRSMEFVHDVFLSRTMSAASAGRGSRGARCAVAPVPRVCGRSIYRGSRPLLWWGSGIRTRARPRGRSVPRFTRDAFPRLVPSPDPGLPVLAQLLVSELLLQASVQASVQVSVPAWPPVWAPVSNLTWAPASVQTSTLPVLPVSQLAALLRPVFRPASLRQAMTAAPMAEASVWRWAWAPFSFQAQAFRPA
jgi:hypothetical protein